MQPVARILDANANRAREALRVMEEAARLSGAGAARRLAWIVAPLLRGVRGSAGATRRSSSAAFVATGHNAAKLLHRRPPTPRRIQKKPSEK